MIGLGLTEGMDLLCIWEGARFENPTASETIGPDLPSSLDSQALIEESKVGEKSVKHDRTR